MLLEDFYKDGAYLRRWHIDGAGQAACPFPAAIVAVTSAEDRDAILAGNAEVREQIELVEAYEAAQRLTATEKPTRDETYTDEDGEERTRWSQAYKDWMAAEKLIDEADADLVVLAELRAGIVPEPAEGEEPAEPEPIIDLLPHVTTVALNPELAESLRVPPFVSSARAKIILARMGLLEAVEAAIAGLPAGQRIEAQLAWDQEPNFSRDGLFINMLAPVVGFTGPQLDQMFRNAEVIKL